MIEYSWHKAYTRSKMIADKFKQTFTIPWKDFQWVVNLSFYDRSRKLWRLPPSQWTACEYNECCPEWLRPEQALAVQWWTGQKWYMITSWTWTGKTRMMIALALRSITNVIFVTPSNEISKNLKASLENFWLIGTVVQWQVTWNEQWYLIMHQKSFKLNASRLDGMIIIDECFAAWTLVDWKQIEKIKIWDYVRTYNHTLNCVQYKKVLHCFKKRPIWSLIKINYSNWRSLITTPEHPFRNGVEYTTKKDIDMMLYIIKDYYENIYMQSMSIIFWSFKRFLEIQFKEKTYLLLDNMFKWISFKNLFWNDVKNKQKICISKNEDKESNAQHWYKNQSVRVFKKDMTQATNTMRQLKTINRPSSQTCFSTLRSRMWIYYKYALMKVWMIANSLQGRYSKWKFDDSYWSWLIESLSNITSRSRQKENWIFKIEGVESIEILEQTSDGTFWWMCPDGYVYNVETEDNHNYFVWDWILVHNCHHISQSLREELILWEWPIIWVTATPSRNEFELTWFQMFFGNIHNTWLESLPVDIWECTYKWVYSLEEIPDKIDFQFYKNVLLQDKTLETEMLKLIDATHKRFKKIIVFFDSVESANYYYNTVNITNKFLVTWSKRTEKDLSKHLKESELSDFIILWTRWCLSEWFDVPDLLAGIVTFHLWTDRMFYQMAWRVSRMFPWKTNWYLIYLKPKIWIKWYKKTKTLNSKVKKRASERNYKHSSFDLLSLGLN